MTWCLSYLSKMFMVGKVCGSKSYTSIDGINILYRIENGARTPTESRASIIRLKRNARYYYEIRAAAIPECNYFPTSGERLIFHMQTNSDGGRPIT